jgi:ABC-type sugar transport system ATPase subunit
MEEIRRISDRVTVIGTAQCDDESGRETTLDAIVEEIVEEKSARSTAARTRKLGEEVLRCTNLTAKSPD